MKKWLMSILVVLPLAVAPSAFAADQTESKAEADAQISIESTSIGAGVGVQWGTGTVRMADGSTYTIEMQGLNVVEAGVTSVTASGHVYNLESIEQIDGVYAAAEAGATLDDGSNVIRMRNADGVVIEMRANTDGVGFKLAAEGVRIDLDDKE